MSKASLNFRLWALIERSPDIEGEWVAHCLDVDVVSQGTSVMHALDMLGEAVMMTIVEDLDGGSDPLLRRAPNEYFERLHKVVMSGDRVPREVALAADQGNFIYAVSFGVVVDKVKASTKASKAKKRHASGKIPAQHQPVFLAHA